MSSNDLTQVRDYVNTRMAVVEPTFKEWVDSITDIGNIPLTLLDKAYHITLGPDSSSPLNDQWIEDSFSVTITIFKRAFNDLVGTRDAALQTANCIRLDLITPSNIENYKSINDGNIEAVESISLTPEQIDETNDSIIKIVIELNFRLFFGVT